MSLHVLLFPKIHAVQHPWIRAMQRVSPALKREIRAFAFLYVDAYPDCFIPTAADPTFELQLDTIRALSDADAALQLARPLFFYWEEAAGGPERLSDPAVRDRAVTFARETAGDAGAELAVAAFDDPGHASRPARGPARALLGGGVRGRVAPARAAPAGSRRGERAADRGSRPHGAPLVGAGPAPRRRHARPPLAARAHRRGVAGESAPARPERLRLAARARQLRPALADHGRVRRARSPCARRRATRVPSTLVQTLRAAGDETRLRILKLVGRAAAADRGARPAREPQRAGAVTAAADPARGRARPPAAERLLRALRARARGARLHAGNAGGFPGRRRL